jgi:uncharacterized protein (TIGR02246 family)
MALARAMSDTETEDETEDDPTTSGPAAGPALTGEMEAAARAAVAALADAFNAHDPAALAACYADEAAWATVMGQELSGRAEVEAFARTVLAGALTDSYARYDVTRLVPLAPDVVAARVWQTPVDADGTPTDAPRGAALYVVARRPGAAAGEPWEIRAGQVTFAGDGVTRWSGG